MRIKHTLVPIALLILAGAFKPSTQIAAQPRVEPASASAPATVAADEAEQHDARAKQTAEATAPALDGSHDRH